MHPIEHDVIDTLVGIMPGTPLDAIRARRSEARKHAQLSYVGLLVPEDPGGVSLQERFAIAAFVAGLHGEAQTVAFYTEGLKSSGASEALRAAIAQQVAAAKAAGPYGRYPKGPLSVEDQAGPLHRVAADARPALGAMSAPTRSSSSLARRLRSPQRRIRQGPPVSRRSAMFSATVRSGKSAGCW